MPLFESLEGDVAAFFVSQGSVFDALVRSFMERMARVETRVDALATDVSANFQSVNQLMHAVSATVDAHAAVAAARLEQQSNTNIETASGSTSLSANSTSSASNAMKPAADPITHMDTHELEYYIMTLSRQLHVVLELFFQPYAHDAGNEIQVKQAQFETISDVLTQNEAILMQLSVTTDAQPPERTHDDQQHDEQRYGEESETNIRRVSDPNDREDESVSIRKNSAIEPILETHDEANDDEIKSQDKESVVQAALSDALDSRPELAQELLENKKDANFVKNVEKTNQVPISEASTNEMNSEPQSKTNKPLSDVADTQNQHGSDFNSTTMEEKVLETPVKRKPNTHERERRRTDKDASSPRHLRKKSLYDSFRNFRDLQLSEEERQQLREQEVLRKVQQLLQLAKKQWQQEITSTLAFAWQQKVQEIEHQQLKMQKEWQCHQEQQRPHNLALQQQLEFDRQFVTFSASFLTAQQTQEEQTARILENLRDFQDQYVQKADFDRMASAWLQTARDECIFGVNADALATFKQKMEDFQNQLSNQELSSPLMEKLLEEVTNVLELLNKVLGLLGSDGDGLHGPEGFQVTQTLRTFLTVLDDLAQNLESDKDASVRSTVFISETLRQMELGTANLLEAFESQHDHYQQAFEQQQLAIAQLQRDLWDQKQADQELKSQLAGCPSQEDTMRFIQELRDQINTSSADSTTRMLETVDELRLRMGGLPNAEVIDRLAQAIQKKADRAEMDRLERLLAATNSGPVAPVGSLMKAPMKCLSCDQNLPYAHTSSGGGGSSSPEYHGGSRSHQQHTCSHEHLEQTPQHYYYAQSPGSPEPAAPGFKELFAASTAASRRRKQRQFNLSLSLSQNNWSDGATQNRALFVNLDDGRNRIPLRRTVLSDQVVYGPAITPNAFKKRGFDPISRFNTSEQPRASRPKTAILPDRRGQIITRSISSTVIIRPFGEQLKDPTADKRANH